MRLIGKVLGLVVLVFIILLLASVILAMLYPAYPYDKAFIIIAILGIALVWIAKPLGRGPRDTRVQDINQLPSDVPQKLQRYTHKVRIERAEQERSCWPYAHGYRR